jgi:hypothetical protein
VKGTKALYNYFVVSVTKLGLSAFWQAFGINHPSPIKIEDRSSALRVRVSGNKNARLKPAL